MSQDVTKSAVASTGSFFVPGTCFTAGAVASGPIPNGPTPNGPAPNGPVPDGPAIDDTPETGRTARDPVLRNLYLSAALADVPRLLGAIDRNPYRPTYGCLDRQYWHYRTSSFPSQMYQEGVLPLALIYTTRLPGNRWQGNRRVRELAIAAIRFAARSSHPDGSCDDYYPFERALGAAVFSLQAAARAYQLLVLDDPELLEWLDRRARWLVNHDESGRLANHQALAALGLARAAQITGKQQYQRAAEDRIRRLLSWQADEGWFEEYGGADPGYQTVTIDSLAKYRRLSGDARLDEPLRRAVSFARHFLHPDGSYGGEYGSRGTYHFYPHGMELLAGDDPQAADLADGFLHGLAAGKQAAMSDDRMFAHRLGNLIEAYGDWSCSRPVPSRPPTSNSARYFPRAGLLVRRTRATHTIISAARGGTFKHLARSTDAVSDAGLIVETTAGRVAVSQMHDLKRDVSVNVGNTDVGNTGVGNTDVGNTDEAEIPNGSGSTNPTLSVSGPLHWTRFETAAPIKQAIFHTAMATVGRRCRWLVRRLLQRRLITARRESPIRMTRVVEFLTDRETTGGPSLRVTDTIQLCHPRIRIRRMSFGTDHQTAYTAAGGVYQESVLQPWADLQSHVETLNTERRVTVVREL